jgi:hypothetical protein
VLAPGQNNLAKACDYKDKPVANGKRFVARLFFCGTQAPIAPLFTSVASDKFHIRKMAYQLMAHHLQASVLIAK